jgi:hypothetical protein
VLGQRRPRRGRPEQGPVRRRPPTSVWGTAGPKADWRGQSTAAPGSPSEVIPPSLGCRPAPQHSGFGVPANNARYETSSVPPTLRRTRAGRVAAAAVRRRGGEVLIRGWLVGAGERGRGDPGAGSERGVRQRHARRGAGTDPPPGPVRVPGNRHRLWPGRRDSPRHPAAARHPRSPDRLHLSHRCSRRHDAGLCGRPEPPDLWLGLPPPGCLGAQRLGSRRGAEDPRRRFGLAGCRPCCWARSRQSAAVPSGT